MASQTFIKADIGVKNTIFSGLNEHLIPGKKIVAKNWALHSAAMYRLQTWSMQQPTKA